MEEINHYLHDCLIIGKLIKERELISYLSNELLFENNSNIPIDNYLFFQLNVFFKRKSNYLDLLVRNEIINNII